MKAPLHNLATTPLLEAPVHAAVVVHPVQVLAPGGAGSLANEDVVVALSQVEGLAWLDVFPLRVLRADGVHLRLLGPGSDHFEFYFHLRTNFKKKQIEALPSIHPLIIILLGLVAHGLW